jgi:hypothetical protein
MTLQELLAEARRKFGDDAGPETLAKYVLDAAVRLGDMQVLFPAVQSWTASHHRSDVRRMEKNAFAGTGHQRDSTHTSNARSGTAYTNPADQAMRKLLAETVSVPDEHGVLRLVRWGDLTVGMHERRIGFLQRQMAQQLKGVTATIDRHRQAIGMLTESGCANLAEYVEREEQEEAQEQTA